MSQKLKIQKKNNNFFPSLSQIENILFFLLLLFLPTQLGKHFWPEFAHIFSLRIDYLSPTLYFWDLLLVVSFIVFLSKRLKLSSASLTILLIFLITQILSLWQAYSPLASLVRLEQLILGGIFALYIISRDSKSTLFLIPLSFTFSLMIESLIGLLEFFNRGSVGLWILGERSFSLSTPSISNFNWYGEIFLRPYATFPHPNVLGAFVAVSLLILLAFPLTFKKTKFVKLEVPLKMTTYLLGFLTGVLSFSRSVVIVLFFELLYLLRKKLKWFLFLVIIALPFLYTRYSSAFNFDILSITRREELGEQAFEQFLNNPIFGVGLNNFIIQSAPDLVSGPSRFLQPVHNIFLLALAETGLIGYLGFLIFLGYPLWLLRKVKNSKVIFLVGGLFFIVIFLGMFDHYFLTLPQGIRLLFFIWGFSLLLINQEK